MAAHLMGNFAELKIFGWLIFAWGAALIAIAVLPSKEQVHSMTRRAAGVLGGSVFCFLAAILIWGDTTPLRNAFVAAAVAAAALSWYLGGHARKVDRAMK